MNLRLVSKLLGIISMLIGGTMLFSLPWAFPALGRRNHLDVVHAHGFEQAGFTALFVSMAICFALAGMLIRWGRRDAGPLFRKEAMAVVGLSWVLATVLGAMPFYLSGTGRGPAVRLTPGSPVPQVLRSSGVWWQSWHSKQSLDTQQVAVIQALLDAGGRGLSAKDLQADANVTEAVPLLDRLAGGDPDWAYALQFPEDGAAAGSRKASCRIRTIRMSFVDALFESQSGFSTTGATVISDLEDPVLVPHCILFWRSSTHFLGGLGIIVLFVAILGQGSAGKALMRAEMPGPSKEGTETRMQHTAWLFAAIYCALNIVLTGMLWAQGLSLFDSLCHAFGTMATGGFSTYNISVGKFDSPMVDYTIVVFMIMAGTNFALLHALILRNPGKLLADIEWRTYMSVMLVVTALVLAIGYGLGDFLGIRNGLRYALFQVVSIMTTTGYGTNDFDVWNDFARGILLLLMFVGGCAGSTGGGMKVIRHILFFKVLRIETEHAYHPRVVRTLRLGGQVIDHPDLRKNILIYFCLVLAIFVLSWMMLVTIEPTSTWGSAADNKLIDSASAIAATLNNIGPGLGTVGATQNYGHFNALSKLLFIWLMMLGRLEIFTILVLMFPSFWRER